MRLAAGLRLPDTIRAARVAQPRFTYVASSTDALAVTLARLAFPGKLAALKLQLHLDWSLAKISSIIKAIVLELFNTWRGRALFDERVFTDPARLDQFNQAITGAGCPVPHCIGFLDGTTFHIARPGGDNFAQAVFYSGHKRYHCLRWQGVITPDGMVVSFYGPCPGASNDRGLLNLSNLDRHLYDCFGQHPSYPGLAKYCLYGDAGYTGAYRAVFTHADLQPDDVAAANAARVSIENVSGAVKGRNGRPCSDFSLYSPPLPAPLIGQWAFTKYAYSLTVNLSPVAAQMLGSTLLYNCLNCLCPGAVSQRFQISPPTLEEYLG